MRWISTIFWKNLVFLRKQNLFFVILLWYGNVHSLPYNNAFLTLSRLLDILNVCSQTHQDPNTLHAFAKIGTLFWPNNFILHSNGSFEIYIRLCRRSLNFLATLFNYVISLTILPFWKPQNTKYHNFCFIYINIHAPCSTICIETSDILLLCFITLVLKYKSRSLKLIEINKWYVSPCSIPFSLRLFIKLICIWPSIVVVTQGPVQAWRLCRRCCR